VNAFSWLWVGWIVYFGVVEFAAIARSLRAKRSGRPDERDTLSEHVWVWFGTDKSTRADSWAYVRRFALLAGLSWLLVHFLGGGRFV
jgi:hypothetical protein